MFTDKELQIAEDRLAKDVARYKLHKYNNLIWFKTLLLRIRQLRKLERIIHPSALNTFSIYLRKKLLEVQEAKNHSNKHRRTDKVMQRLKGLK